MRFLPSVLKETSRKQFTLLVFESLPTGRANSSKTEKLFSDQNDFYLSVPIFLRIQV